MSGFGHSSSSVRPSPGYLASIAVNHALAADPEADIPADANAWAIADDPGIDLTDAGPDLGSILAAHRPLPSWPPTG